MHTDIGYCNHCFCLCLFHLLTIPTCYAHTKETGHPKLRELLTLSSNQGVQGWAAWAQPACLPLERSLLKADQWEGDPCPEKGFLQGWAQPPPRRPLPSGALRLAFSLRYEHVHHVTGPTTSVHLTCELTWSWGH